MFVCFSWRLLCTLWAKYLSFSEILAKHSLLTYVNLNNLWNSVTSEEFSLSPFIFWWLVYSYHQTSLHPATMYLYGIHLFFTLFCSLWPTELNGPSHFWRHRWTDIVADCYSTSVARAVPSQRHTNDEFRPFAHSYVLLASSSPFDPCRPSVRQSVSFGRFSQHALCAYFHSPPVLPLVKTFALCVCLARLLLSPVGIVTA